jgi:hypothetical protein
MVADVRYDDRLALRYADGEKCAVGASSRHSIVLFDNDHVNLVAASAAEHRQLRCRLSILA